MSGVQPRRYHQPQWTGEALAGKRILLFAEQGLGDTIQFIRYAPLVKQLGATTVFEVHKPLLKRLGMSVASTNCELSTPNLPILTSMLRS